MMSLGILMLMTGYAWQAWSDAGNGIESTMGAMIGSVGLILCIVSFAIYAWRVFP